MHAARAMQRATQSIYSGIMCLSASTLAYRPSCAGGGIGLVHARARCSAAAAAQTQREWECVPGGDRLHTNLLRRSLEYSSLLVSLPSPTAQQQPITHPPPNATNHLLPTHPPTHPQCAPNARAAATSPTASTTPTTSASSTPRCATASSRPAQRSPARRSWTLRASWPSWGSTSLRPASP